MATDHLGRETIFVGRCARGFIVSASFWEVVAFVQPESSDFDEEAMLEHVVFQLPLDYRTIVKGIDVVPPATILRCSGPDLCVSSRTYWDIVFDTTEKVKKTFDEHGISIPFPQRDVHIHEHKAD